MLDRRDFLKMLGAAGFAAGPAGCLLRQSGDDAPAAPQFVNDIHSRLNRTRVASVNEVCTLDGLLKTVRRANRTSRYLSVCGSRHAMGGQQFGADTVLLDMRSMCRVLSFDAGKGIIEAESGIQWPALIDWYLSEQKGRPQQWGIRQKQTGANLLSLGGALGANVHGRGLAFKPIIDDIVSFDLVTPSGDFLTCSRRDNPELFGLVIGGYGLFGVVYSVKLRLAPRQKIRRFVDVTPSAQVMRVFEERVAAGFIYGDFQFNTDNTSDAFLRTGILSCYAPVPDSTPIPDSQRNIDRKLWLDMLSKAYVDDDGVFSKYVEYYRGTSGQVYWSDTHHLSTYVEDFHTELQRKLCSPEPHSLMITELYVPRSELASFLDAAARDLRARNANVVYGVVRLIERDSESFLAWAKQPYACVIFNIGVCHTPQDIEHAKQSLVSLIDLAQESGGSYYLTYHRWASKRQVLVSYPQMPEFLALKRKYDPQERIQSDWYRHYRAMFSS